MWLLDPRNGPEHDLAPTEPRGAYVVASIPRSGSTLLGRLLGATGAVGEAKEWLNPMQIRDFERRLAPSLLTRWRHAPLVGPLQGLAGRGSWDAGRVAAYLDRIRERRTGPSGRFGLKIHHHHFAWWFERLELDPERLLGPTRWVAITRADRVAQAVSWYRALQTGRWASSQRALLPPVYDGRRIARLLERIEQSEQAWRRIWAARRIEPLEVTYEALVADPAATVRRVLDHLGVAEAERVEVPAPPTSRQADATSEAWIARFRAEEHAPARRS